jgi:hypothetical protein
MDRAQTIAGAVFAVLGALMMFEALKLAYMIEGVPGPGFLPRWVAGGLVLAGVVLTAKGLRPALAAAEAIPWPDPPGRRRLILMLGALALALVLLDSAGFVVVTTVFMGVVVYGLGVRSRLMLALVPLGAAVGLYVVFAVWLRVPLPKGIFSFLP